jgi:RND family efflux transporter MFP subunit
MTTAPRKCYKNPKAIAWFATLAIVAGCGEEPPPFVPPPQLVDTVMLEGPETGTGRNLPATVQAHQKAVLAFQVSGPLVKLPVKEGDIVEKGALLAQIDPRDFQNQVNARKAIVDEAYKQFKRYEQLLKTKTVPQDQFEEQKARYEIAAAESKQAEKDLDDTRLRAPFDGLISKRYVENFQNVKEKEPVVLLEQVSQLDVVVQVEEQVLASLEPNEKVLGAEAGTIAFQAIPGKEFPATVKEYRTQAEADTQTYKVTFTLPAPKEATILPGMTAAFTPSGKRIQRTASYDLPVSSVITDGDGNPYVWLVDRESMTVSKRPVKVGQMTGSQIRVLEGLKTGDEVVTAGASYLAEGYTIRLRDRESKEVAQS